MKYKIKKNSVTGTWELWHGVFLSEHVDQPAAVRQMKWHAMWTREAQPRPALPERKHWWQRYTGKHRKPAGPVNTWEGI